MLRLKNHFHNNKDDYLSIPDSEPLTLLQVSNENLPYACQCPLCGGIFEIPKGVLYKVEDDGIEDVDSDSEFEDSESSKTDSEGFLGEGPNSGNDTTPNGEE